MEAFRININKFLLADADVFLNTTMVYVILKYALLIWISDIRNKYKYFIGKNVEKSTNILNE